jgi:hypothetical protein
MSYTNTSNKESSPTSTNAYLNNKELNNQRLTIQATLRILKILGILKVVYDISSKDSTLYSPSYLINILPLILSCRLVELGLPKHFLNEKQLINRLNLFMEIILLANVKQFEIGYLPLFFNILLLQFNDISYTKKLTDLKPQQPVKPMPAINKYLGYINRSFILSQILMACYVFSKELSQSEKIAMTMVALLAIPNMLFQYQKSNGKDSNQYYFSYFSIIFLNFMSCYQVTTTLPRFQAEECRHAFMMLFLSIALQCLECGINCLQNEFKMYNVDQSDDNKSNSNFFFRKEKVSDSVDNTDNKNKPK